MSGERPSAAGRARLAVVRGDGPRRPGRTDPELAAVRMALSRRAAAVPRETALRRWGRAVDARLLGAIGRVVGAIAAWWPRRR